MKAGNGPIFPWLSGQVIVSFAGSKKGGVGMARKPSFDAVVHLRQSLSDEEWRVLIEAPGKVKKFAADLLARQEETTYITSLSDDEAIELLVTQEKCNEGEARCIVSQWRKLAAEHGHSGPTCWRVRPGFTLKKRAPKAGPCYEGFRYLQGWSFEDEATPDALVFWIPRLLASSTGKNVEEQKALLGKTRERLEMPAHHLSSFGNAALVAGLILAEFARSGDRVPLRQFWARTDTRNADGLRLYLGGFGVDGLDCGFWNWDDCRLDFLGCFSLGVEALGS